MRSWSVFGAIVLVCAPFSLSADEARNPAIEGVIQSQIDAFLAQDVSRAFTFASPGIRQLFGTPANFGDMVRNGYPMVWRPSKVTFGALRDVGGALWQTVVVTDAAGVVHVLDYQMDPADGTWVIDGVVMQRAPAAGA